MKRDKFRLPPSLKGKVFRADEFFRKKARSARSDFLIDNLSHCERVDTPLGRVIHRKITISLDGESTPEGYALPFSANLRHITPGCLSLLAGEPEGTITDFSRVLFLDLETTGLAGGAGTYAFLCGIGYFDQDMFAVEQFFMEDYPREPAMLELLKVRIAEAEAFVTFNGKTFDIPLLATRFIFNRTPFDTDLPHIDLLHPSRRIWKGVLTDCRLGSIEKEFFHLERKRDVDGGLIPQIYFNFTRGAHQEWMPPVFDHNVQDIATLAGLLLFFCGILSEAGCAKLKNPLELWGLGRLFLKFGRMREALESMERALLLSNVPEMEETILIHLGKLYKKTGRHEDALDIWERLLTISSTHKISAAVEMAKYYEHRAGKPETAHEIMTRALKNVEVEGELQSYLSGVLSGDSPEITPEIEIRIRRLEAKIYKNKAKKNALS